MARYTEEFKHSIVSNLCCASLLSGFGSRKSLIDDYLVRQVIESEFAS